MSEVAPAPFIGMNGEVVPWGEARIHAFSPAVKYGAGVFEGIRGYWNDARRDMYVFRLMEHMHRLEYSQKVMGFERIIDAATMAEQTLALLRACAFRETVHVRAAVVVDGYGEAGATGPTSTLITAVPRPLPKKVTDGVEVQVSSWQRIPDHAMPMRVKANANYNNGRLADIQAVRDGYDAALMLNTRGKVSEGPGMCFFMIRNGRVITPSTSNDILESITRETLIEMLGNDFGLATDERDVDRSELYAADEAFFCGTGWEITPIRTIDRLDVGDGKVGSLTRKIQERYFAVVSGTVSDHADWRTPVYQAATED